MKSKQITNLRSRLISMILAVTILFGLPMGFGYCASAASADLANAQITLSTSKTGRIARNTTAQITITDKDTGTAISVADATSVEYSISPASKASVDSSGLLTANDNGAATITMTVNYSGESPITLSKSIDVEDSGENLMDDRNGSFENVVPATTPSDWQSVTYAEPASPTTFYYTGVTTATGHDGNANNQVLAVNLNSTITSTGALAFELMYTATPTRRRINVHSGTIYELSFYVKPDSIVYPTVSTVVVDPDIMTYINGTSTSTGSILSTSTDRSYDAVFTASSGSDWQKITIPVPAPTTYTGNIYISPKIYVQATKSRTGFSGRVLFDDIELREVGYDHVDVVWPELSEANPSGTLVIQPNATTGTPISIIATSLPASMSVTSSDAAVASSTAVTAESLTGSGNIRGNSTLTINSAGEAEITASATVNGVTKSNVRSLNNYNLSEPAKTLSSIAVTTLPSKTTYTEGETLDITGMVVSATYSDNSSAAANGFTCSPTMLTSTGTQQIAVSYTEGEVTKTATFNVTVNPAADLLPDTGRIRATATDSTTGTAIDGTAVTSDKSGFAMNTVNNFELGEEVTIQAVPVSGKTFRYWKNVPSNRIVSTSQSYTFKVGSDTYLTAVYSEPQSGQYLVEFIDKNGKVLQSSYLNKNATIVKPADPFSVGYTFAGWSPSVPATATNSQVFYAQYSVQAPSYTLTLAGPATIVGGNQSPYAFNQQVTLNVDTASIPAGQKFECWQRDEKIISYEQSYSFYVWDSTTVTAVCSPEATVVTTSPQILMDSVKVSGNRVIFMSERTVPAGYELVETGILMKQGSATSGSLKLVGGSYDLKAVAQSPNANGQFSVRKDNTSGTWYARAYVIYKSGSNLKVIYSNTVNGTVQ